LTEYPACDDEVQRIAGEVWGNCDGNTVKEHAFGSGKVVWGLAPEAVLTAAGVRPDFTTRARLNFIHRRTPDSEIYFVANPRPHGLVATCAFRVVGKQPWLWWPDTGRMEKAAIFTERDGATNLTLQLDANGSVFVLFRPAPGGLQSIVALTRDNSAMLSATDIAPRVEIRNAVYGVLTDPQRTRDVRDKVQQLVDAGEHSFRVARLADQDDPALNLLKTVAIEYAVSGKTSTVTGDDNDTVHLLGDAPKIQVDKAVYGVLGDPVRTRDMREKLQHILDTGETSFQVARLAQGDDPAPGVVKTLQLACMVEGRPITLSATDSENVILYDPPSAEHSVDVRVDDAGNFVLETREDGEYEATTSEGKHLRAAVRSIPLPLTIAGPWEVRFPQGWGAPERASLDPLIALNEHADPAIRYFSGTATYQKEFEMPTDWFAGKRRFYLDLGAVHVMAAVTINGVHLGTIWKPPYMVDVTDVVRPGKNALTAAVANQWINRMIGDEQLADDSERNENGTLKQWPDWLLADKPSPSGRYTFTTWRLWHKNDTLAPSGLAGPVTLHCTEVAELLLK